MEKEHDRKTETMAVTWAFRSMEGGGGGGGGAVEDKFSHWRHPLPSLD